MAKIDKIQFLFFNAANKEWPLHQFDVKNAFLDWEIKEEIYMEALLGFSEDFKKWKDENSGKLNMASNSLLRPGAEGSLQL